MGCIRGLQGSLLVVGAAAWLASSACGDEYGSDDSARTASDGGPSPVSEAGANPADGSLPAPDTGFSIAVSPARLVVDRGDASISIQVTIARAPTFGDAVEVTLNALPPPAGVTGPSDLVLAGSTLTGPISFAIGDAAVDGDYPIEVLGKAGSLVRTTSFGLRIGSVLARADTTTMLPLPSWVRMVAVNVWGAGGGGGDNTTTSGPAGWGGPGGYVSADLPVDGTVPLELVVGTGGPNGTVQQGAGGGGYSAIKQNGAVLLVAGGGGGGGSGSNGTTHDAAAAHRGVDPAKACAQGGGATDTAGGAAGGTGTDVGVAGGSLLGGGGSGDPGTTPGGAPGGGASVNNAGGGGGGFFGGGSGGSCGGGWGGGGGGSAFVVPTATNVRIETGTDQTPFGSTLPGYTANAPTPAVAVGGARGRFASPPTRGGQGRVIVRLPKP